MATLTCTEKRQALHWGKFVTGERRKTCKSKLILTNPDPSLTAESTLIYASLGGRTTHQSSRKGFIIYSGHRQIRPLWECENQFGKKISMQLNQAFCVQMQLGLCDLDFNEVCRKSILLPVRTDNDYFTTVIVTPKWASVVFMAIFTWVGPIA